MEIVRIEMTDPRYQKERELRNRILLRPIGIPDYGWEQGDHKSWHFVATKGDQVLGCVILCPLNKERTKTQLMQMAVEKSWQGKGVGKMLVTHLIDFAKNENIEEIIIHSRSSVNNFYLQFGFKDLEKDFEEVGIQHSYLTMAL